MNTNKLIALTFDDGPSNVTDSVLDILEKENIPGTFFLIGSNIKPEYKSTYDRQLRLGCEIANHSYTHSDMSTMDKETIKDEISKTTALIKQYYNVEPKFFRPPFISVSDTMYESIDLPFICGKGCEDWVPTVMAKERTKIILDNAKDGMIVLLHDLTDNHETVKALPNIINELKAQGYSFVTLSKLFEEKEINPNQYKKMWSYILE